MVDHLKIGAGASKYFVDDKRCFMVHITAIYRSDMNNAISYQW
jgi:hypothetical protein